MTRKRDNAASVQCPKCKQAGKLRASFLDALRAAPTAVLQLTFECPHCGLQDNVLSEVEVRPGEADKKEETK